MRAMKNKFAVLLIFAMLLTSCSAPASPAENPETSGGGSRVIVDNHGNIVEATGQAAEDSDFIPAVKLSDFDRRTDAENAVEITLNGTDASCTGDGVTVEAGRITITDEGSYVLTGSYTGQIVVQASADDNVQLILNHADITGDMAPIYIVNCKNASVTLAQGTVNSVTDSRNYTFAEGEDEPDAAIFSDCDLTINGEGTLNVTGNYACGIRTKDDLRIVSGNINVTSVGDAVKGRDSLQIAGGTINIVSEADGLKSNNDEDSERGYIVIDGGNFSISAGDDGVHAESWLIINDGNLTVSRSYEGLEAMKLEINGGNLDITASDDALNAASPSTGNNEAGGWFGQGQDPRQNGGNSFDKGNKGGNRGGFTENNEDVFASGATPYADKNTGSDGSAPENMPQMPDGMGGFGGMMGGMTPPEGMEMPSGMELPDGMTMPDGMEFPGNMTPPDGAEMPADGAWGGFDRGNRGDKGGMGGFGGMMGGGMPGETAEDGVWIRITGGNIRLVGGNDVLDSNGIMEITGGTLITDTQRLTVYGMPDGVFDANGTVAITGGTYAAYAQSAGSIAQITQNPSLTVSGRISADTAVEVKDFAGSVIFSDTTRSGGSVFFFTSDQLKSGGTYTVTVGDTSQTVTAQ